MTKLHSNTNLIKQTTNQKTVVDGIDAMLDEIMAKVIRQEKKTLLNADSLCKMVVII